MIRNQWYVVLESRDVPGNRPVGVIRLGERLVFWRDSQGKVVCLHDRCPHLGARLSQGQITASGLACPFHGFTYNASGQCVVLPAYGRQAEIPKALRAGAYATHEAHDLIWIYWGEAREGLAPPAFFESLEGEQERGFSYASFRQHWRVHYSRMVENQLDVMHLPFVHYNTIGRGGRVVVDGPQIQLDNDLLNLWVHNRPDDGAPPRKAEDMPASGRHPSLQFRFPNLWQNWISDDLRILVAFIPVDEENSVMLGRYYQRVVKLPLARELFNLLGKWSSIYIAGQDRRVVNEQMPKKSALRGGEKYVQGDRAILTYRRRRQELLDQNDSNPGVY